MIIKKTHTNERLIRRMASAINRRAGYKAIVDTTWNCGKDIRLEIGTIEAPFIVSSWYTQDGGFEIKLRMIDTKFDDAGTHELTSRLASLNAIVALLKEYVAEAKPELSEYDSLQPA